ncbi:MULTISPECIES: DNA cytosine methyltransferase [Aliarcobacter]|uniref:DNA cytosine methyltransferase n=1 Tax=Aliarcobacter TaxID=2321111 RepID=UPI00047BC3D2|nr:MULTISPECIES: DNA cytosine methyltransferase [Aliarcobacter]MCG3695404.1 DNA cytosine methyltransferase [Aliarcobacter butzleri]
MKVISLFSGAGGFDLGFKKSGFEIVWANDFDKEAVETYKKNIGKHIIHDSIYNIKVEDIPDADILIGGFPCLGFTVAKGKDRKLDCDYNQLFQEYARVLAAKQPKYFIVENVTGIKSGKEFNDFFHEVILETFKNANYKNNYKLKYETLISSNYGVPQNRKRIIILGTRHDIENEPNFPNFKIKNKTTLKDAIYDLPMEYSEKIPNHIGNKHKVKINGYVGNRQLDWDKPSPTITGRGSRSGGAVIHPHPERHRRLTIRECARIQSFPDDFHFIGSNGACYSQIGNAVPPIMSFFIANQFRELFGKDKLKFNDIEWKLPYSNKII